MPGGHDTAYLQSLVGDALARGVASAVATQPNDPVDFLGNWLLKYVKNAETEGQFHEQKRSALEEKKRLLKQQQAHALKLHEAEADRKVALAALAAMDAEPQLLAQHAVNLIKKYTVAGGVYAAAVADPEEPDWTPPEDAEDAAAAESDDEADPLPPPPPVEGEAAEAPAAEAETPAETDGAAPKIPRPVDYSKKYFSYLAASPQQDFMCTSELFRPAPPPEDAGDDYKPELPAPTFRILDERVPMLYSANVALEPGTRFFRDFPKIGSYQACGVQVPAASTAAGGEFKAIIAADTLFPEGNGQPLSQADQDFIWEVSLALSKAYEAREVKAKASRAAKSAAEAVEALKKKIVEVYYPPPPEVDESAEVAGVTAPPVAEPAAAAEDGAPPAEPPIDDSVPPAEDADPILVLAYDIRRLTKELAASAEAQEAAGKALELASVALQAINTAVVDVSEEAVVALRDASAVPQATFHVLKAVLHLLGKEPETLKNWKRCYEHLNQSTFDDLSSYDATQERNPELWKRVRQAYKGVKDAASLAAELPATHLGVLLIMYIKQVRKVARKAAAHRGHCSASAGLGSQLEEKETALAELERVKAEQEAEAARLAAEAEVAAAAEEAARLEAEAAATLAGEEGGAAAEAEE